MIYNMYIFNRRGTCVYYRRWHGRENDEEKQRLVFGMLYSMNELVGKLSGSISKDGMLTIKTNSFTMHQFHTASGTRFVLNTDNNAGDLRQNMYHIYAMIWVECVVKSPMWSPMSATPVDSPLFDRQLETYLEGLTCFR
ncbi:hypothetical protein CTAYLR_009967 [Chrysophaeum taylorii]|uniref:Trafficking protein particle complex subunit n=1 Tax=Chrysophaeum taylorii TaxID=2483200 RepID=A0AAD7XJW7_9STRA|nr:hypothetical protein CTAYLR_009967 [Chrysophaeum taylorii]